MKNILTYIACGIPVLFIAAMEIGNRIPNTQDNMIRIHYVLPHMINQNYDITITNIKAVSNHITPGRLPWSKIAGEIYQVEYITNKDNVKHQHNIQIPNEDNWYLFLKEFGMSHLIY